VHERHDTVEVAIGDSMTVATVHAHVHMYRVYITIVLTVTTVHAPDMCTAGSKTSNRVHLDDTTVSAFSVVPRFQ
jgi:hypothetical protein